MSIQHGTVANRQHLAGDGLQLGGEVLGRRDRRDSVSRNDPSGHRSIDREEDLAATPVDHGGDPLVRGADRVGKRVQAHDAHEWHVQHLSERLRRLHADPQPGEQAGADPDGDAPDLVELDIAPFAAAARAPASPTPAAPCRRSRPCPRIPDSVPIATLVWGVDVSIPTTITFRVLQGRERAARAPPSARARRRRGGQDDPPRLVVVGHVSSIRRRSSGSSAFDRVAPFDQQDVVARPARPAPDPRLPASVRAGTRRRAPISRTARVLASPSMNVGETDVSSTPSPRATPWHERGLPRAELPGEHDGVARPQQRCDASPTARVASAVVGAKRELHRASEQLRAGRPRSSAARAIAPGARRRRTRVRLVVEGRSDQGEVGSQHPRTASIVRRRRAGSPRGGTSGSRCGRASS